MIPFPEKRYSVIYADPPWAYVQNGGPKGKRGMASAHYETMSVDDICNLPVRKITGGGGGCSLSLGNIPKHSRGSESHASMGVRL